MLLHFQASTFIAYSALRLVKPWQLFYSTPANGKGAAAWLLAFPQEEITGLALRIGFSSSQNFAKAFRAHFAVSPGEFRRRHILATKSKPGNVVVEKSPYSHFTAPSIGLLAAHISRLPARRVAYMRRFGPYGKETCQQTHQDLLALLPARTPSQPAGTSLRVLGCAGDNLCCTLPNGRRSRNRQ